MPLIILPILLLLVAAIYWSGLAGGFVFDDYASIVNNNALQLFDGSLSSLIDASTGGIASPLGRPLSLASFALNFYFTGNDPYYFKLVNLLIHLGNGLLVFMLVRQLWPRLVGDERTAHAALWVSALWLLHPINLTPVLYVVQRMTSLATLFTLAALSLYLYGRAATGLRRWTLLAISLLVCWPAGILVKESALLLPVFILLYESLVLRSFAGWPVKWRWFGLVAVMFASLGLLIANGTFILATYHYRDFSLAERLLTEARVLWFYLMQIVVPWPDLFSLHHDDIPLSRGLTDPPLTALATAGWLVVLVVAFWQRRRRGWLSFALLWYLGGHVLESTFLGLEIAYEHRNYLPSLGIFIGLAAGLLPAPGSDGGKVPRLALALSIIVFSGVVTGLRAAQWGDEYVRTQIESNTHPESSRTHNDAARAILDKTLHTGFMNLSAYNMTRIHYQRAAQFDPNSKAALMGVLYVDCAVEAKKDLATQTALFERLAHTRSTLGDFAFIQSLSDILSNNMLCMTQREIDDLFAAALSNPWADGRARAMWHAVAMDYAAARLGSLTQARVHAQAAVESDPGSVPLHINLIRILVRLDDSAAARRQYAILRQLPIPPVNRAEVENLGLGLGG